MEKEIIKTGCRIYDRVIRRDGVDAEGKGYALVFFLGQKSEKNIGHKFIDGADFGV